MTVPALILYFVYPIIGLCTLYVLQQYKMKVAYRVYFVAFLMIFLYLPVYAVFGMLGGIETCGSTTVYFELLREYIIDPLSGAEGGMIFSNCIVIAISAFICISAVCFAFTSVQVIRKIRSDRVCKIAAPGDISVSAYIGKEIPKRKFCCLYCRYTC